ncbi:MAG: ammonium transporter [Phycisphaeraceae bacterium]
MFRWLIVACVSMLLLGGSARAESDPPTGAPAGTAVGDSTTPPASAEVPPPFDKADTAWMLMASALVLFMTPGLAFFYGGLVRRKNVLSVLMQCFMCMGLVTVIWVFFGFSLAFGGDTAGGFIGDPGQYFLLNGVGFGTTMKVAGTWTTVPGQLFAAFQCMFAIITPALILGAFAERMKFSAFTLFIAFWLIVVYCPVAHWVWGGAEGFFGLGKDGALDFAGGTVIHVNAGVAALVAVLVMGKRQGYPTRISPPHNLPFAVLGAGMLWFGWFGFNAGSAGGAGEGAVRAFAVTHIAAATAGFAWSLIEWMRNGRPTVLGIITGAVAGLVAITPASGYVDAGGALCIGLGACIFSFIFVAVLKEKFGYDDSLDVFGVHGIAGLWGAIATGIFAVEGFGIDGKGGLLTGNIAQLGVQFKALLYTVVWSAFASFVLLKFVDMLVGLRPTEHDERVGLDLTDHAETAYTLVE